MSLFGRAYGSAGAWPPWPWRGHVHMAAAAASPQPPDVEDYFWESINEYSKYFLFFFGGVNAA